MTRDNKQYANSAQKFANQPPLQVTLRELQALASSMRFWIGFVAVVALLTITGPFGTQQSMDTSPRLVYWAVISLVTFFTGSAISISIGAAIANRKYPDWIAWLLGGLAAGIPVGVLTWFINIWVFYIPLEKLYSFPQFIAYVTGIAIIVVTLTYLISSDSNAAASVAPQSPFFKRLPKHLGATLISLEAQDHYINVITTNGSKLILMRLADAEKELGSYSGLRVHRSWWVATDAVQQVKRTKGKVELVMEGGNIVPVSRSYIKALGSLQLR